MDQVTEISLVTLCLHSQKFGTLPSRTAISKSIIVLSHPREKNRFKDPSVYLSEHFDGSLVDRHLGSLDDGTEDFDGLFWWNIAGQNHRCFLGSAGDLRKGRNTNNVFESRDSSSRITVQKISPKTTRRSFGQVFIIYNLNELLLTSMTSLWASNIFKMVNSAYSLNLSGWFLKISRRTFKARARIEGCKWGRKKGRKKGVKQRYTRIWEQRNGCDW